MTIRLWLWHPQVLWSSLYEFPKVIGWHNAHYWSHFNILLLILFSLQVRVSLLLHTRWRYSDSGCRLMQLYWFSLIFKITVRHLYHGEELNDTREKNLHLEEKGSKQ